MLQSVMAAGDLLNRVAMQDLQPVLAQLADLQMRMNQIEALSPKAQGVQLHNIPAKAQSS